MTVLAPMVQLYSWTRAPCERDPVGDTQLHPPWQVQGPSGTWWEDPWSNGVGAKIRINMKRICFLSVVLTCAAYENNFLIFLALAGFAQPIHGKESWISLTSSIIKQIVVLCWTGSQICIAEFLQLLKCMEKEQFWLSDVKAECLGQAAKNFFFTLNY